MTNKIVIEGKAHDLLFDQRTIRLWVEYVGVPCFDHEYMSLDQTLVRVTIEPMHTRAELESSE